MKLREKQTSSKLPARLRKPWVTRLLALLWAPLIAMASLVVSGIGAIPASAAMNIHVEMTGADDPACGSTAAPCRTIGYAYSVRAAANDTITVGPGEFYADDPYGTSVNPSNNLFLYITKTVHFVGAQAGVDGRTRTAGGAGETIIYNRLDGNPSPQLWYVAAPDVTVDGFTFSDVLTGPGHYELLGSGSGGAGVQTRNEAGGVPPPEGTDSDGWTFVNNVFDMTDIGLYVGSVGTVPSLIEHNLFVDNGGVINSNVNSAGIYSDHPTINTTITENTFAGHVGGTPINIASAFAEPSSNVTISDNKMDGQESVDFYNTADSVITGNSMIGVQRGIALDGGDRGITISDNTISGPFSVDPANSRNCIQLSNTWDVGQNSDVTIFDNVLDHCVTGGISVANTDKVTADYNLITNSGSDGILVIPNTNVLGRPPGPPTGPRASAPAARTLTRAKAGAPAAGTPPVTTGVTMTRNTITGSTGSGISVAAGSYTGPMLARFNRIVDNGTYDGLANNDPSAVIDARWNWWGCNTPNNSRPPQPRPVPGEDYGPGCGTVKGTSAATVTYAPWLVLTIAANPADVNPGQGALISSTVHTDSAGGDTAGLSAPPSPYFRVVPDDFTAATGHVSPDIVTLTPQLNGDTNWPAGQPRPTRVCSTVDHQTVCLTWKALPAHPALQLEKTAAPASYTRPGDSVTYSFKVTNTGNVTVHDVSVTETAFSGAGPLPAVTCPQASLAAGHDETCTVTYHVSQADIDAGQVTNTAVAHAADPDGAPVASNRSSAVVTAAARVIVPAGQGRTAAQLIGDYLLVAGLVLAPFAAAAGAMTLVRRRRSA
jgi:uncharacterized repeat protein (TIGR01451 family)